MNTEPTQLLTDEEFANVRANLGRADRSDAPWDVVPNYHAVRGLLNEVDRLRAENTAQAERSAAVAELHRPVNHRGIQVCNACTSLDVLMQTMSGRGRRGVEHPCATRRALGLDQGGGESHG